MNLLVALYSLALRLYPESFRRKYAGPMLDAARRSYAEATHPVRLTVALAWDLLKSIPGEHLRVATPASPAYTAAFALFFTFLLLTVSVGYQQVLRRQADKLPVALVDYSVARIAQGADPAHLFAGNNREISSSQWLNSSNFIDGLYNHAGEPVVANATLHGALPHPPAGIFLTARARGRFKVTWQPEPKIRVALTIRPLPDGNFVLAGQSLIPSESREFHFDVFIRWLWLAMSGITLAVFLLSRRFQDAPRT